MVVFERTLFNFERPWGVVWLGRSGVSLRIEIAGEAPPDAMLCSFLIELSGEF